MYPDEARFCAEDGHELAIVTDVSARACAEDPRLGSLVLDRYELRRAIADGGMGRVYEALDQRESRNVAIKILHDEVAMERVAVERFKREAEVSGRLSHEYIAEVFDFASTAHGHALVMEFLYGEELRSTLKRMRCLSPERLVRMLSQVAIGLDGAHTRQLVHRDLKPDNIFLCQTPEGDHAKILDFGSVKDNRSDAKKLTMLGTTIGSPFYMSPEQAQGLETLDYRADVWSLAAITYEAVTGNIPFSGTTPASVVLAILSTEPAAPSVSAGAQPFPVPTALDAVIAKGLSKQASARYTSAGALADAVGSAYGLAGDHHGWAREPQSGLRVAIQKAMTAHWTPEPRAAAEERVPSRPLKGESTAPGKAPGVACAKGWAEVPPTVRDPEIGPGAGTAAHGAPRPPTHRKGLAVRALWGVVASLAFLVGIVLALIAMT